ncbi:MAG: prephenate dehydrogenase/arogenate dehydrogenase family protein [Deltaproteobacteria bacterium]|nr:prephenate dehydrogenase/arogenate dehydrogenase family protein [Deltaproteobacteria bacterium]
MNILFKKVAIIGVGLIGGSLAMVLRKKGLANYIVGIGRGIANLEAAKRLGVVDEFTQDHKAGVKGADLVVIAIPVGSIARMVADIATSLQDGTIVTDVGSVKGPVVKEIEEKLPERVFFVGGHPIAGTEDAGVEAAFPTLFEGRKCILTPTLKTNPEALQKVRAIWGAAGSVVVLMDADRHDEMLAGISHLPHIIAYALVNTVKGFDEGILGYSAGGFRDFTRIASSPPEMWRDICLMNRDAILDTVERFQKTLEVLKGLIEKGDGVGLFEEFMKAKGVRDAIKTVVSNLTASGR